MCFFWAPFLNTQEHCSKHFNNRHKDNLEDLVGRLHTALAALPTQYKESVEREELVTSTLKKVCLIKKDLLFKKKDALKLTWGLMVVCVYVPMLCIHSHGTIAVHASAAFFYGK